MGVFDKFLDIMKLNDDDYDDDEFYDDDDEFYEDDYDEKLIKHTHNYTPISCLSEIHIFLVESLSLSDGISSMLDRIIPRAENARPYPDHRSALLNGYFIIISHTHRKYTHINIINVFLHNVNR